MALCFGGDWYESLEDDTCLSISSAMRESLKDDCFFDSGVEQISNNKVLKSKQPAALIQIGFDSCYNQMKKELTEKDKEIESLKVELDNLRHFCDSILDMAKRNDGVLYFKQNDGTWEIETGKDNNALTNPTDNNVGSMEE